MFSTVDSSTATDPEFWIRLVTSRNSRIQVMLYQKDNPEFDEERLTDDERLACFRTAREKIVEIVKVAESPYFQVPQSFE